MRPAFCSWSWLGWEGYILVNHETYSEYDQKWLLKGTWTDWHKIGGQKTPGSYQRLWDPARDVDQKVSPLVAQVGEASDHDEQDNQPCEAASPEENEDAEDAIEPCPSYGEPTENEPYGRTIHPRVQRLLAKFDRSP
jgi:hypothetical protein